MLWEEPDHSEGVQQTHELDTPGGFGFLILFGTVALLILFFVWKKKNKSPRE